MKLHLDTEKKQRQAWLVSRTIPIYQDGQESAIAWVGSYVESRDAGFEKAFERANAIVSAVNGTAS